MTDLQELRNKAALKNSQLSRVLDEALPHFRNRLNEQQLEWCRHELHGYEPPITIYKGEAEDLSPYRLVVGAIRLAKADGSLHEIDHPIAQQEEFFVCAPLSRLEKCCAEPGEISIVELPVLTAHLGEQMGGKIVCECDKSELERIITGVRLNVVALLDQAMKKSGEVRTNP
ncbi:MAG TPA: hypothetical protein V6D17_23955 [Candidatus Obscuribacterales bacterium]